MAGLPRVVGYRLSDFIHPMVEYRRFNEDYFSGADVRIYFGDIWVDEITRLEFTLQENVAPIYGYASYTWDKVARGSRQIQGSFSINFKESYYLFAVLEKLAEKLKSPSIPDFDKKNFKEGVTIEHLLSKAGHSSFDDLAEEFEKSLWGESKNQSIKKATNQRSKDSYFYPEYPLGRGQDGSFQGYDESISQKALRDNGFDILITYGPYNEPGRAKDPGTVESLIGVQLTGVSKVIGQDGKPIEEQYTFIAKDFNAVIKK